MARTCLVTGGAGFIGSHVVDALLARGDRVRVLDDFSSGKRENLAHCRGDVKVIEGDVRDGALVRAVAHGCDTISHQAALVSVERSFEDPGASLAVNLLGTLNVLAAAAAEGIAGVAVASSCAVYGDVTELPLAEDSPRRPLSPYAVGKAAGEDLCRVLGARQGIPTASLRYFNVYGPRQDAGSAYSGVVSRFVTGALRGRGLTFFGDGRQSRDFVYVEDVTRANVLVLDALASERPRHRGAAARSPALVLNVGTGRETTLLEIADTLETLLGSPLRRAFREPREGEIRRSCASPQVVSETIGFEPSWSLKDGLQETLGWYAEAPSPPS